MVPFHGMAVYPGNSLNLIFSHHPSPLMEEGKDEGVNAQLFHATRFIK